MRIVGGRFRGRALTPLGAGDEAARLRPTSDRVREAVFNRIAHGPYPPLDGARVLDLFAGSGALGLEALSRGAARVMFVENGVTGRALIRKNIDLLGVIGETKLLRRDATRLGPASGAGFDMVFADPPYGKGLGVAALASANHGGWLAPGALVLLEEGAETPLPNGFITHDTRRYGDTWITLGQLDAAASGAS